MAYIELIDQYIHIRKTFIRRVVLVLIVLAALWVLYSQFGNAILKPLAVRRIEQMTSGQVDISDVEFRISGEVRITYLGVIGEQHAEYDDRVLRAQNVDIFFSPLSLLRFKPVIKRITIEDFFINPQFNTDTKAWNLDFLNAGQFSSDTPFPIVRAEKGYIKFSRITNGQVHDLLGYIGVSGTFSHTPGNPREYGFFIETDSRLAFGGSVLHGIWRTSPQGGQLRVINSRLSMENTPILNNVWEVENLNFLADYTSEDIERLDLSFTAGERTSARFRGSIANYLKDPSFDITIEANEVFLTNTFVRNAVIYSEQSAFLLSRDLKNFLNQFRPKGWGDIAIHAQGTASDLKNSTWRGTLKCYDVSMMDRQFVYPLENLRGTLDLTERGSVFPELLCNHGEVDLRISGYAFGGGKDLDMDVTIQSDNMKLDQDLHLALSEKQKQLWLTFTPQGKVKILYNVHVKPGQEKQEKLEVELDRTRAVYSHFPYELRSLTGKVVIDPNEIVLREVNSHYSHPQGDYDITLNGRISETESERPKFNILIDANNVPIDDMLMRALPAAHRKFYEKFQVDARTHSRIKVFPNEVGKRLVEYIAWVKVRQAAIQYEKLPLRWTDVNVDAILTPDLVRLEQVTARSGRGSYEVSGKIWPNEEEGESPPAYCLHLDAREVEINEEILMALPRAGETALAHLKTGGPINVTADLNSEARDPQCLPYAIEVECLGNSLVYDRFAYPLENITGRIRLSRGRIVLDDLNAVKAGAGGESVIYLDGSLETDDEQIRGGRFTLNARGIELDDDFQAAFAGANQNYIRELSPGGRFEMELPEIVFERGADGELICRTGGTISLDEVRLGKTRLVTDMQTEIEGSLVYHFKEGLREAAATIFCPSMLVKKKKVTDLRAKLDFDPKRDTFEAPNFTANLYGGRLIGNFELARKQPDIMQYLVEMVFDQVDLTRVFEDDQMKRQSYPHGMVQGSFSLSGSTRPSDSPVGRLNARVTDVRFAKRTLPGKVVTAAKVKEDAPTFTFDRISIESFLRQNELVFEEILMERKSSVLRGSGDMNLKSSQVDLTFQVFGQRMTREPSFIGSLFAGLGPAILQINVTGTAEHPQIRTETLSVLRGPIDILGPKE